ncbi:helix-turn-helix domain-containing protein [Rhodococcus sp. G-MC3]|uniref:PucR family transcriptional regulator n=1 Tax=Rhodococcus sp. G-MC3 TaxID=3046209 RepID=UPI0024B9DAFB|nr:helix-turn-helix domain-containing protein [Rhodococcus sp. G-MC3]MDJ0396508.1 helix-turn-helix domain-containing protein [Rhodococcus sp. G-MC3]
MIYLQRWTELTRKSSTHAALPGHVRTALERLVRDNASADTVLDRMSAHLGGFPCVLVTAAGRVVARSWDNPRSALVHKSIRSAGGVGQPVGASDSPYDAWFLQLHPGRQAPPGVLHEMAEILQHYRESVRSAESEVQHDADKLLTMINDGTSDSSALASAIRACGLPDHGPYRIVVASTTPHRPAAAVAALRELLSQVTEFPFVVHDAGTEAIALYRTGESRADLVSAHQMVQACDPRVALYVGMDSAVHTTERLFGGLVRARHARRAAATLGRGLATVDDLTCLPELLAGIDAPVRASYSRQVLGPLLHGDPARVALRLTLQTFLDNNGSWIRTAEAVHLHVNTVHYRIERVEHLTGRDLSDLDDRADLRVALFIANGGTPEHT